MTSAWTALTGLCRRGAAGLVVLLLASTLSGCLYGGQVKSQQAPAPGEYIVIVQNAVDQFKQRTGVLPIKTKDSSTPLYEKYPIDFKKLSEYHLLSTIPPNAFENGGSSIYVLVDAETKPTVKLMDLVSYQEVGELQKKVFDYMGQNGSKPPAGHSLDSGYTTIDYTLLNRKELQVRSPFSGQMLPVVMNQGGRVYIDYSLDLVKTLAKQGADAAKGVEDLRELLVKDSPYVPALSQPYKLVNGEPRIMP
ncbi:hypothetical protein J31TS4_07600 [Paenibacillus sp. J31TS4]|uniref:DUF3939 domain-containing protein n=1 Tax=Paenibacillus sp. J31TS4 TaxID=2807195 RepID=UPI001B2B4C03|nr:DUF3939 domain-containing protein [Paenibacillus sp. J31TS4]GIP37480.1 hypothetical protein J31TS4_07600 [Paenibacillus sp. J31TS4]